MSVEGTRKDFGQLSVPQTDTDDNMTRHTDNFSRYRKRFEP